MLKLEFLNKNFDAEEGVNGFQLIKQLCVANRSDSEAYIHIPAESRKVPNCAEWMKNILSSISC